MRLQALQLKNFRAFREEEIDLSGDLIAIYGRNGAGKTTVFDAIEFAFLGSIGRFAGSDGAAYLSNVYSGDDVRVRLLLYSEKLDWIESSLDNGGVTVETSSGERVINQRDLLYDYLVIPDYLPPRREVAAVAELFRANVLLSQDNIKHFITGNETDRIRILSHLAGSGFYQRCLGKAREVLREAERLAQEEQSRLSTLKDGIEERSLSMAQLTGQVEELRETLSRPFIKNAEVWAAIRATDLPDVASRPPEDPALLFATFHGSLTQQSEMINRSHVRAAELETLIPHINELREMRDSALARIGDLKRELSRLNAEEQSTGEKLKVSIACSEQLETDLARIGRTFNGLKKLPEVTKELTDLSNQRLILTTELERLHKDEQMQSSLILQGQTKIQKLRESRAALQSRADRTSTTTKELNDLLSMLERSSAIGSEQAAMEKRHHRLEEQLAATQTRRHTLFDAADDLNHKAAELKNSLSGTRASYSELKRLVMQVRKYVTGQKCPVCGHPHESAAALQREISMRLRDVPQNIKETEVSLQSIKMRTAKVTAEQEQLEEQRQRLELQLESVAREARSAAAFQEDLENRARTLDVSNDAKDVSRSIATLREELGRLRAKISAADTTIDVLDANVRDTEAKRNTVKNAILKRSEALENVQDQHRILVRSLMALGFDEESLPSVEKIVTLTSDAQSQLSALEKQLTDERKKADQHAAHLKFCTAEQERLRKASATAQTSLARGTAELADYEQRFRELGIDVDRPARALADRQKQFRQARQRNAEAIRALENYEAARKFAALDCHLTDGVSELQNIKTAERNLQDKIHKIEVGIDEIQRWVTILSECVGSSVEDTIAAHEPEISRLFKSMIPCPYVFDRITMRRNGGLKLGLRYRGLTGDAGEPKFFLSSAQANILALSIFLSLARHQRWSRVDTLLLDDPVQLLDDLDAVAFIDNLRAIAIGTGQPRRQIILSTCDRNFYLLMIRKFRLFKPNDLHFTAISLTDRGADGPSVHYDIGGPQARLGKVG